MPRPLSEFLSKGARDALHVELGLLRERRDDLQHGRDRQQAKLDELESELRSVVKASQELASFLGIEAGVEAVGTTNGEAPSASKAESSTGSREGIAQAIDAVFAAHGAAEIHYKQLSTLLQERGVTLGGKDPAATLLSFITNVKYANRYERCGRGTYRLTTLSVAKAPKAKADNTKPEQAGKTLPLRKSRRRRRVRRSNPS